MTGDGMTKDVTLHLGPFGQQALERFAQRREASAAGAVRTAALYYLADRDAGRPGWRVPAFDVRADPLPVLNVELDDDTWSAVREEAARQSVEPEDLAVHAVLYFLADVDSGRLADLLGEALDDAE
jgi:hypothetical protein